MTCFSRGLAGHAHEFINANGADGAGDGNDADADDCAELIVMVVMPSLWSGDDADGNGDAGDAIRSGGGDVGSDGDDDGRGSMVGVGVSVDVGDVFRWCQWQRRGWW